MTTGGNNVSPPGPPSVHGLNAISLAAPKAATGSLAFCLTWRHGSGRGQNRDCTAARSLYRLAGPSTSTARQSPTRSASTRCCAILRWAATPARRLKGFGLTLMVDVLGSVAGSGQREPPSRAANHFAPPSARRVHRPRRSTTRWVVDAHPAHGAAAAWRHPFLTFLRAGGGERENYRRPAFLPPVGWRRCARCARGWAFIRAEKDPRVADLYVIQPATPALVPQLSAYPKEMVTDRVRHHRAQQHGGRDAGAATAASSGAHPAPGLKAARHG